MGSITREELIQMVRDFIESESTPQISEPIPMNHGQPNNTDTLKEIIWRATDYEVEVLEKILMYVRNMGCLREPNNSLNKWVVLRLKKDGYEASLCKTSWTSFHGLAKGGYEFVDVMIRSDQNMSKATTRRLMVDMDFRSQFVLSRPTQSYKMLFDTLCHQYLLGLKRSLRMLCRSCAQLQNSPSRKMAFTYHLGEKPVTCSPNGSLRTARELLFHFHQPCDRIEQRGS